MTFPNLRIPLLELIQKYSVNSSFNLNYFEFFSNNLPVLFEWFEYQRFVPKWVSKWPTLFILKLKYSFTKILRNWITFQQNDASLKKMTSLMNFKKFVQKVKKKISRKFINHNFFSDKTYSICSCNCNEIYLKMVCSQQIDILCIK